MRYYAGIGSRDTPEDILREMEKLAIILFESGYALRSGGAPGADQAFERGLTMASKNRRAVQEKSQIFLPWPDFEKENRTYIIPALDSPGEYSDVVAKAYHPAWNRLSYGAKKLISRNTHQIVGPNINKPVYSEFVVCWTKNGKGGGGTGQALRIAKAYEIPIYDLAIENTLSELRVYVRGKDAEGFIV